MVAAYKSLHRPEAEIFLRRFVGTGDIEVARRVFRQLGAAH
jgi:hypothetical protein